MTPTRETFIVRWTLPDSDRERRVEVPDREGARRVVANVRAMQQRGQPKAKATITSVQTTRTFGATEEI